MRRINYFKADTDRHRSPMARRQQQWDWLRKMKKQYRASRKEFVKAANGLWNKR